MFATVVVLCSVPGRRGVLFFCCFIPSCAASKDHNVRVNEYFLGIYSTLRVFHLFCWIVVLLFFVALVLIGLLLWKLVYTHRSGGGSAAEALCDGVHLGKGFERAFD